jgi:pimeloyl-ACP methyl ester carboxylesterase
MAESMSEVFRGELAFPVRTAGPDDGEPVIFLHGFPQTSATWSPYLARFSAAGFRAIAPGQRGYVTTARPTAVDQYALDHLVADVLGVADGLGVNRFHLVGHDWGGIVGWALAAAHPERLRSLTSISTPHPRAFASSLWRSFQLTRSWYVGFFQIPQIPERLLMARNGVLLRSTLRHSGLPDAHVATYADTMLQPGAMTAAINYYRALRPRHTLAVGRITVPALYVWSTNDIALGPVAARATGDEVDAPYQFEVLEGASHWIPETRLDELSALVLKHVSTHASPRWHEGPTADSR